MALFGMHRTQRDQIKNEHGENIPEVDDANRNDGNGAARAGGAGNDVPNKPALVVSVLISGPIKTILPRKVLGNEQNNVTLKPLFEIKQRQEKN